MTAPATATPAARAGAARPRAATAAAVPTLTGRVQRGTHAAPDGIGGGGGDGGGDGGGCFLTTAIVELRGEPDGGPTLTALRAFRDGYMTRTAERRALVAEYYDIAPMIVAAIPRRACRVGTDRDGG